MSDSTYFLVNPLRFTTCWSTFFLPRRRKVEKQNENVNQEVARIFAKSSEFLRRGEKQGQVSRIQRAEAKIYDALSACLTLTSFKTPLQTT